MRRIFIIAFISCIIGDPKQLSFKIKLKRNLSSTESYLSACRIIVKDPGESKLEYLKTTVISKFKKFHLTEDNFDLYWEDSDGDTIIIADNDDLSLALQELHGPKYELLACLHTMDTDGKSSRHIFVHYFISYYLILIGE